MLLCSPAGNDLLYDDSLPEQGRNFSNKIWNAFRLVKGWERDESLAQPEWSAKAVKWINGVTDAALVELDHHFEKFRISDALMTCYKLFWDEFSSWYLEIVKPAGGKRMDAATYDSTIAVFVKLLKMIHPFMPFITEEIWHLIEERKPGESLMMTAMPEPSRIDRKMISDFSMTREIVSAIRTVRKDKNIPNREAIDLHVVAEDKEFSRYFPEVIARLCNVGNVQFSSSKIQGAASFMAGTMEFLIPLTLPIDTESEKERITGEISYFEGFLKSVEGKLSNASFVSNAPAAVVENERKKKSDAEMKLAALRDQLASLG
jgi:valyl-tRNA synthetase